MKRSFVLALGLATLLSFEAGAVLAHADLGAQVPADGATVAPPAALVLTFTEAVTLEFTGIALQTAGGQGVETAPATLSEDGLTLSVAPAAPLAAGAYVVEWHALSDDGHKSQGHYGFTVQ